MAKPSPGRREPATTRSPSSANSSLLANASRAWAMSWKARLKPCREQADVAAQVCELTREGPGFDDAPRQMRAGEKIGVSLT